MSTKINIWYLNKNYNSLELNKNIHANTSYLAYWVLE